MISSTYVHSKTSYSSQISNTMYMYDNDKIGFGKIMKARIEIVFFFFFGGGGGWGGVLK